jgi:hypothetical protein
MNRFFGQLSKSESDGEKTVVEAAAGQNLAGKSKNSSRQEKMAAGSSNVASSDEKSAASVNEELASKLSREIQNKKVCVLTFFSKHLFRLLCTFFQSDQLTMHYYLNTNVFGWTTLLRIFVVPI